MISEPWRVLLIEGQLHCVVLGFWSVLLIGGRYAPYQKVRFVLYGLNRKSIRVSQNALMHLTCVCGCLYSQTLRSLAKSCGNRAFILVANGSFLCPHDPSHVYLLSSSHSEYNLVKDCRAFSEHFVFILCGELLRHLLSFINKFKPEVRISELYLLHI
jgi:hypothetical protein